MNVRAKGQVGEREVAQQLNDILAELHGNKPFPQVMRNQLQTAIGGCDLVNTFDLAIEVKRQETLNIKTWWEQAKLSAEKTGTKPVLIYRQNRKPWKVVMYGFLLIELNKGLKAVVEIDWETFKQWFRQYCSKKI